MNEKFTSSKTYRNRPCAHRQWKHEGHCAYIHGYSRQYTFHFEAKEMDEHGWVVGFGDLKKLEKYLLEMYDHTMIIAEDDPELDTFVDLKMDLTGPGILIKWSRCGIIKTYLQLHTLKTIILNLKQSEI